MRSLSSSILFLIALPLQGAYFRANCSDSIVIVRYDYSHEVDDDRCYFLQDLQNISSNTEVRIYSTELFLTKTIELVGVKNVSLVGYNNTILRCLNSAEAGLLFRKVQGLVIESIEIHNCATELKVDEASYNNIRASIAIQNCANVLIRGIRVMDGPGSGLAFFNIEESLTVLDSTFEGNGHDRSSGGNGVYLEIDVAIKNLGLSIHYNFTRCNFINNSADTGKSSTISGFSRFDKGGGLCCSIRSNERVRVTVEGALISGNTAGTYGGGIFAAFSNNAANSVFTVKQSNYTKNKATYGGAQSSGYLHNQFLNQTPLNCSYKFEANTFTENWALYGGGTSVYATPTVNASNTVNFKECVWQYNIAQFGSAISILPHAWNIHKEGYLPEFIFSNCTIDSNYVRSVIDRESQFIVQYSQGSGALYCTDHKLQFSKRTTFSSNNGSALYAGLCTIKFSEKSHTTFRNNTGYYGGAIHLLSSLIQLNENVKLFFEHNTAFSKGGAIYHNSLNYHMYNYSRTCFFRNVNTNERDPLKRNVLVSFTDNFAGTRRNGSTVSAGYGHSMYVYSLLPCHRFFKFLASNLTTEIFTKVGNFSYEPNGRPNEIATDARQSHIQQSRSGEKYLAILPGKEENLAYSDIDDLGQNTTTVYLVTVKNENGDDSRSIVQANKAYEYMSSSDIILHGNTGDEATVVLSALTSQQRTLSFRVKITPCPPGFTLESDSKNETRSCQCADDQYGGIQSCQLSEWRAYAIRGYWIGYESGKNESEDTLVTSYCPVGFCTNNEVLLPATADRLTLNEVMCPDSRMGILCGLCKANYSVYYHSLNFQCKPNRYCKLGWLFYILSEIVPVTIIFAIIIFFNISFTSGVVNGFIFYSQVVSMLGITAGGFIPFSPSVYKVVQFLYLGFSLNPLVLDELSFCLFEGASALDVIAFSYISLVYSFLLVIGIIVLMNKLSTRYCCKAWRKCTSSKRETLQGNVIHGLSAFLVLCYAKCARSSILLVSSASIQRKGSEYVRYVVFYNGEFKLFGKEHLLYAVPAIVMSLLIVISPPILLIVYPMHYKILTLINMAESRCARILFKPLEKLKPLLDSFQGSFKDEFRFFSGLYFLYRLLILVTVTLSKIQDTYFILSGQLLLILLLHTVCQPYKKRCNNRIDSFLFFNLAAINSLTIYNSVKISHSTGNMIGLVSWIQTILILLPLVTMLLCVLRKGLHCSELLSKVKKWGKGPDQDDELPARLVYELESIDREEGYKRMD